MNKKVQDFLGALRALPKAQRVGLSVGVGALIGVPALFLALQSDPQMKMMVPSNAEGISSIIEELEKAQVRFEVNSNGSVWVVRDDISQANLVLAKAGYPEHASTSYDKLLADDSLYMSQNKEALRSRQILEENLESTIQALDGVERAHVRLAIASETSFLKRTDPSSASVVVIMKGSRELSSEMVTAIGGLVANGVKNLPLKNVKVIDKKGRLLSSFDQEGSSSAGEETTKKFERDYDSRAVQHLSAIFGFDAISVSSTFNVNFDKVTNTTKVPIDPSVVLSRQIEKRSDGKELGSSGIPGATSNQPPDHADYSSSRSAGSTSGSDGESYINEIINYEVGTSITRTESQVGNIENVNVVAVVDQSKLDPNVDLENMRDELSNALSLLSPVPELTNVRMIFSTFNVPEMPEAVEEPFWKQSYFISYVDAMLGKLIAVVLALIGFLLARRVLAPKEDTASDSNAELVDLGEEEVPPSYEQLEEELRQFIEQQPENVSEAIRSVLKDLDEQRGVVNAEEL